jgi:peptidoglycan/xylan/chitin deacetylase (PgdA/CDA1 family)
MSEPVIPILLYHKLGRPPSGARVPGHYVSPGLFRRQLCHLKQTGHETVSLSRLARKDARLPARPLAITFDDGYQCVYEDAFPQLQELGFSATVFMVAGAIGGSNIWEQSVGDVAEPMLSLSQVREMAGAGVEFGSHTVSHPHLTDLPIAEAAREVHDSRRLLEDTTGAPCLSFAYPYGDWNVEVRELVAQAGYVAACTTRRAAARPGDDPLALPRINIRRYNVLPRFRYKLWRARRRRA